jgi:hypothetical protein
MIIHFLHWGVFLAKFLFLLSSKIHNNKWELLEIIVTGRRIVEAETIKTIKT